MIKWFYICISVALLTLPSCIRTNIGGYIGSYGTKTIDYQPHQIITNKTVYKLDGEYYLRLSVGEKRDSPMLIYWENFDLATNHSLFYEPRDAEYVRDDQLCEKRENVVFLPLRNSLTFFNYEESIALADFDFQRAVPCGNSTEWHKFFPSEELQNGRISINLRTSTYPKTTALYYCLYPFACMGYMADIPCSVVATGSLWVAIPFIYGYQCTIK